MALSTFLLNEGVTCPISELLGTSASTDTSSRLPSLCQPPAWDLEGPMHVLLLQTSVFS